jgi:Type II secretion system (T2SS), protein E, N-terminal domain
VSPAALDQWRAQLDPETRERLQEPYGENERPEERLMDLGLLDEHKFASDIAERGGRQLTSLVGIEPDPGLLLYLPVELAERESVFPIILVGDTLVVASAFNDPDLSLVESHFPKLELEVQIAPRSEVRELLERAKGGIV